MLNIQKLIEDANEMGYQGDKAYIKRLDTSDKRWIDEEIDVVTRGLLEFVSNI